MYVKTATRRLTKTSVTNGLNTTSIGMANANVAMKNLSVVIETLKEAIQEEKITLLIVQQCIAYLSIMTAFVKNVER